MGRWWKKSCTGWYGKYPIIYKVESYIYIYMPGGAGFLPSKVCIGLIFWETDHLKQTTKVLKYFVGMDYPQRNFYYDSPRFVATSPHQGLPSTLGPTVRGLWPFQHEGNKPTRIMGEAVDLRHCRLWDIAGCLHHIHLVPGAGHCVSQKVACFGMFMAKWNHVITWHISLVSGKYLDTRRSGRRCRNNCKSYV